MSKFRLSIVRFVDEHQPGWVECHLIDAAGELHRFIEKAPVISHEDLWNDTAYPRPTEIEVTIVARLHDKAGASLIEIDTDAPWGIASTDGRTRFTVRESDFVE